MHPVAVVFKVLENLAFPVPLDMDAEDLHMSLLVLENDVTCEVLHAQAKIHEMTFRPSTRENLLMRYRRLLARVSLRLLARP